ncbi:MAG: DUF6429 family protein [Clostridia bacterium]|nr:DUF6429 family protein [Clostridia bacterium]
MTVQTDDSCDDIWRVTGKSMDKIKAEDAMHDLTLALIYLSRFTEEKSFKDAKEFHAWKAYDFNVLNRLEDEDLISQGSRPYKNKSVYITDTGLGKARQILEQYGIEDWQ